MLILGSLGFTAPWLLLGLLALPLLWMLLRAVPPAPVRRTFPGVILLLGLDDKATDPDRTPWWLLALRLLALGAVIAGFAGPVLNPDRDGAPGSGPLLILLDGTWADARDWPQRGARIEALVSDAGRAGRPIAIVRLTDPAMAPQFQPADAWAPRLAALEPASWIPTAEDVGAWQQALGGRFDTFWLSDGLAHAWRDDLLQTLERAGEVRVFEGAQGLVALRPAGFEDGTLVIRGARTRAEGALVRPVALHGLDPAGTPRVLARADLTFDDGAAEAEVRVSLPPELRNRVTRFEIEGIRSAGAVALADDTLRRREVALLAGRDDREGLQLLSPLHFLEQALEPTADLIRGSVDDIVLANPDAVILADVATLAPAEAAALEAWVREGGLLVRFAGPRMAAADEVGMAEDPLLPVRLRAGGRSVGGAMSWGEPKTLRPFPPDTPFHGLTIPDEVAITAQVMAQPDPQLAGRTIASLADGTPLVTRSRLDDGQVVLFHTTANAEWSTLPLSGLFVQMLERLAISTRPTAPTAEELAGTTWAPDEILTGFGRIVDAGALPGVAGEALAEGRPGRDLPPGIYAGDDRRIALNAVSAEMPLSAAVWPDRVPVEGLGVARETPLKGWLLTFALLALAVDIVASLWLAGRLTRTRGIVRVAGSVAALALMAAGHPLPARGQQDDAAIALTSNVVLAHVITGDARIDAVAADGLRGLSRILLERTSVEPADPVGVDLETAELAFFPMLYWPVSADQPIPSDGAYSRLNAYLRSGGMIVFDTRDGDIARLGSGSPEGRRLQQIAAPLDVPPLEPLPSDHVLTRSFYLLQDFPGRHASRDIWVESAPPDAEQADGMPFRNLNDNVTPVVIGGNDWAAAWASDDRGLPLYPVGRGYAGERQREIAYRFGVNLVMHVLTGNYKSDQVHVPALLDRLGN